MCPAPQLALEQLSGLPLLGALKKRYQARDREIRAVDENRGHQLITDFFQRKPTSKSDEGDKENGPLQNSKKGDEGRAKRALSLAGQENPLQEIQNVLLAQNLDFESETIQTPKRRREPLSTPDTVMKAVEKGRFHMKEENENVPPANKLSCEDEAIGSPTKRR